MFAAFEGIDGSGKTTMSMMSIEDTPVLARTRILRRSGAWEVIATAAELKAACVHEAPASTDTQPAADADEVDGDVEASESLLQPLTVGRTWTYRVHEDGEEYTKVITVEAEEKVGGDGSCSDVPALKVVTTGGGQVESIEWRVGKSQTKTFWFVPEIRKVKEDGDVLEQLVRYEVAR